MRVRVRLASPGFFAVDAKLSVELDGRTIHEGSFIAGFSQDLELEPGTHTLSSAIRMGFSRKRSWSFEVPEDDGSLLVVRIVYSRFWGNFESALKLEHADPSAADAEDASVADASAALRARPTQRIVGTWALLATLALVFLAELALGLGPGTELSPSVPTLVALGGLVPESVASGLWFRVVSCTFLHANFLHLLFNGVALMMAGLVVESILGARWLLTLYFISGLAGSAVSLALNDESLVSVGASGAIMGIFAAGMFVAQTLPAERRGPVQFQLLRVLVPSLLPIAPQIGGRVDFGAHAGGAVGGAIMGALLLLALRRASKPAAPEPVAPLERSPIALAVAGAFVASALAALVGVAAVAYPEGRERAAAMASLLPDAELPQSSPDAATLARWLERYPDDPRVRIFAAESAFAGEDWTAVAAHLARGRGSLSMYPGVFPPASRSTMENAFGTIERDLAVGRALLPNRELPTGSTEERYRLWVSGLPSWLERYPDDPRVRERAAWVAVDEGDFEGADAHARRGLEQAPRFDSQFPDGQPSLPWLRAARAIALVELGRAEEAAPLLGAACRGEDGDDVRTMLGDRGLCAAAQ